MVRVLVCGGQSVLLLLLAPWLGMRTRHNLYKQTQ